MSVILNTTPAEPMIAEPMISGPMTAFAVGTSVDVKNRYVGSWSSGFEIAGHVEDGYVIRRLSDGSILPDSLSYDEVRPR
jgi:hypothetical protein